MKIRPVILCGGAGTRLWPNLKNTQAKQFIDFGGWTLLQKAFERINNNSYDFPIISTNLKYLKDIKKTLKKSKIKKYKIILEPAKKNTAPAILVSALIKEIPTDQPIMFFTSDHLIENPSILTRSLKTNVKNLSDENIFIFGIKPTRPSNEYGYLKTKSINKLNKVTKFIEKPTEQKAKKIIKSGGYWNSGMFYLKKSSIINNFKKYQPSIYKACLKSLEKSKNINAIKLSIQWSDLGNWFEISKIYKKNKNKYFKKKNVFHRPWGRYTNLYEGKNFLVKELVVNSKSKLSLQKHFHRSEYWTITDGKPLITLNKKNFFKKPGEKIFIPREAIHRIENKFKKKVKIIEIQTGPILKETDIVRYQDIYGRVN